MNRNDEVGRGGMKTWSKTITTNLRPPRRIGYQE